MTEREVGRLIGAPAGDYRTGPTVPVCSEGTYRRQVIHFGLSVKDDPTDRGIWGVWLGKFEAVLRRLYWWSALAHLDTNFEPQRVFEWLPTEAAVGRLRCDPPQPAGEWARSVQVRDGGRAAPLRPT
jgi:hypothetical protein